MLYICDNRVSVNVLRFASCGLPGRLWLGISGTKIHTAPSTVTVVGSRQQGVATIENSGR